MRCSDSYSDGLSLCDILFGRQKSEMLGRTNAILSVISCAVVRSRHAQYCFNKAF